MKKHSIISVLLLVIPALASGAPTTYSGVTLPDGDISFADSVVAYLPGPDVGANYNDPSDAIGPPDYVDPVGAVSLGEDGVLILQFTDNSLTTSGDNTPDLHIFEIGYVEYFNVSVSTNLTSWVNLGNVLGQPTSIDIDGVAGISPGERYSYVRLADVAPNRQYDTPYGEADIDAVAAISSSAPVVPAPGAILLAVLGASLTACLKRRGTI